MRVNTGLNAGMDEQQWGKDILITLAEALRTPVLQMKLGLENGLTQDQLEVICEHALRDLDSFITIVNLPAQQRQLALEPVALGSILKDSVERVRNYARMRGTSLQLDDHAKHQLVLANSDTARLGMELLLRAFCDVPGSADVQARADTRHGYPRLGVYRSDMDFRAADLNQLKKLLGKSSVSLGSLQQLVSLRIVMASQLFSVTGMNLRSAKSDGRWGVAVSMSPSDQLGMFGA